MGVLFIWCLRSYRSVMNLYAVLLVCGVVFMVATFGGDVVLCLGVGCIHSIVWVLWCVALVGGWVGGWLGVVGWVVCWWAGGVLVGGLSCLRLLRFAAVWLVCGIHPRVICGVLGTSCVVRVCYNSAHSLLLVCGVFLWGVLCVRGWVWCC